MNLMIPPLNWLMNVFIAHDVRLSFVAQNVFAFLPLAQILQTTFRYGEVANLYCA